MKKFSVASWLAGIVGATIAAIAFAQQINQSVYVPNPANAGFPPALVMGAISVGTCGGLGTGTCAVGGTSNGAVGIITLSPTGSPAGTGSFVVTWTPPASNPNFAPPTGLICDFTFQNGTGSWNGLAASVISTVTQLSNTVVWTNGTTPTPLTAGSTYKLGYQCGSY